MRPYSRTSSTMARLSRAGFRSAGAAPATAGDLLVLVLCGWIGFHLFCTLVWHHGHEGGLHPAEPQREESGELAPFASHAAHLCLHGSINQPSYPASCFSPESPGPEVRPLGLSHNPNVWAVDGLQSMRQRGC
jgi:hypothetical protein